VWAELVLWALVECAENSICGAPMRVHIYLHAVITMIRFTLS